MDEIWQRHKTFILQCAAGGFVFLIALVVKSNMYSGADDPEDMLRRNTTTKQELAEQRDKDEAPNTASIDAQKKKADEAERQIRDLAGKVASVERKKAYVHENIDWVLGVIGQSGERARFLTMFENTPQACLSSLRSEARSSLVGRAAELGKELDESLGLEASYQDDEVPIAIHGLAIVADLIDRCLVQDGIDSVPEIAVRAQSRGRRSSRVTDTPSFVKSFQVRITMRGDPVDVMAVVYSMNRLDNRMKRMTVIDTVDHIVRERPDVDTVKATVTVLGMQHLGLGDDGDEGGGEE